LALAGGPVATVTSPAAFELRGAEVKVQGVPSWPVLQGDLIATKAAPAVIVFKDGSRVSLHPNSKARVESTKDGLSFRLLDGFMQILAAPGSGIGYLSRNVSVKSPALVETVVAATPGQTGVKLNTLLRTPPPPPPDPISTR
jgi:ferric-dicitrate binding protein FerR (iron transport regulator)